MLYHLVKISFIAFRHSRCGDVPVAIVPCGDGDYSGAGDRNDFRPPDHPFPAAQSESARRCATSASKDSCRNAERRRWAALLSLISILIPTLLFGDLTNVYTRLMIVSTVWLRIDRFPGRLHQGVSQEQGRAQRPGTRSSGRSASGLIVGCAMWLSPQIVTKEKLDRNAPRACGICQRQRAAQRGLWRRPKNRQYDDPVPSRTTNSITTGWCRATASGPTCGRGWYTS